MASLSRQPGGRWTVQFVGADGKRRSVRLGKCDKRTAEAARVKIEALVAANLAGHPPADEVIRWVAGLGDVLKARLARVGLTAQSPTASVTLGRFIDDYIAKRPDVKASTVAAWGRTRRVLLAFFGAHKPLRAITAADARDFERWLHTPAARVLEHEGGQPTLAEATIRRRIGHCRQFWNEAIARGLASENPFAGITATTRGNAARQRFVTREMTERLLAVCPNPAWRLLVCLARYGGLRVPSESHALTWADIDWQRKRIRVPSVKTARHPGHEAREIPLFPELEKPLLEAWEACPEGEPTSSTASGPPTLGRTCEG